jgi:hypothetical protein
MPAKTPELITSGMARTIADGFFAEWRTVRCDIHLLLVQHMLQVSLTNPRESSYSTLASKNHFLLPHLVPPIRDVTWNTRHKHCYIHITAFMTFTIFSYMFVHFAHFLCHNSITALINIYIWVGGATRWRSGWGTALQTVRSRERFPMVSLKFFIDIIWHMALGSIQPLTEMSTRSISWG